MFSMYWRRLLGSNVNIQVSSAVIICGDSRTLRGEGPVSHANLTDGSALRKQRGPPERPRLPEARPPPFRSVVSHSRSPVGMNGSLRSRAARCVVSSNYISTSTLKQSPRGKPFSWFSLGC